MALLPEPKRWTRGQELVVVPRSAKVRRPARISRSRHIDQVRLLDRAIEGFLGSLKGHDNPSARAKSIKSIDLLIVDEVGNGTGTLSGSECYELTIDPEKIVIAGTDAPALRAGLVSLTQLLVHKDGLDYLPTGKMLDWPSLALRGFHVDLSCQSLDFDYACGLVRRLAQFKYNALLLEWGDKFPYQGHRILSHPDAFTPRQVSQFLDLAEGLGLVVIPLIQTLAHVEFILKHPQFAHLSEIPGDCYQLATANPESLVLAKQLVDQIIESHPNSPYVHLGGNEATQLGRGVSAESVARKGKSLAWVDHMNVACRHVQARGRTPIVWADMPLAHPQALNRFTRDCLMMHWNNSATSAVASDFYQVGVGRVNAAALKRMDPETRQRFEPFWSAHGAKPPRSFYTHAPIAFLQKCGFKVIAAPSVRSLGDNYCAARVSHHIDNCYTMAHAAVAHKCLGLMVTNWSVRRSPIETTAIALTAAGQAAWNGGSKPSRDIAAMLAETILGARTGEVIDLCDSAGRAGTSLLNAVVGQAWDRRRGRHGVAPLLGRVRRAGLASLTSSSEPVKHARKVQKELKQTCVRLSKIHASSHAGHGFLSLWRHAAHEVLHKANQWLWLWQVARIAKVDRGPLTSLARQGAHLLDELRHNQRGFKRTAGKSMGPAGLAEELEIRFGAETRLIRRLVHILRSHQPRLAMREQLSAALGMPSPTAAADK